ncbi:PD-(D/E)XK nuclease family protein [Engelhardtia mirabilis]|uniref:PD-(D/E)XK nuclease superfamily protein n=1 Tax=Engelhardtia mirabilis TaxID=2528011 RepID=A0A518BJD1_9BACT|nr:PD-(D/E)XK nuclease superfamily protein [Planctomycetes bacterium Pla133]QDV01399.1 PD-(D/E)XK nuclease superfamily protein [Planctomycetes bacterium Pla86]
MAFAHELSWSVSRSGTFATCRRSYYHNYYLSWLGWSWDAPPQRKLAYKLKKLTRLPMWAGDCLHEALAAWFEEKAGGRERDAAWVEAHALKALRDGYKQSRDEAAAWEKRPAKNIRLAEHYYGEPSVDESNDNAKEYGTRYVERIREGTRAFFEAPELERVRAASPEDYLACEELGTIELNGTKVFAIPDFAFREGDDVWIYDWKTGSPREQDLFQLAMYCLYAEQKWGVDPSAVRCVDAYLPSGQYVEKTFTIADLDATLARATESMAAMRAVHFDADAGMGDPADFPQIPADSPEARECRTCHFRELCDRV